MWVLPVALAAATARAEVKRLNFGSKGPYLALEVLDDDLIHVELSAHGHAPAMDKALYTTPMVLKTDYHGPRSFQQQGHRIESAKMRLVVDGDALCLDVWSKAENIKLTRICPSNLADAWKSLTLSQEGSQNVYGLGEQFRKPGDADGDWMGSKKVPGGSFGQAMVPYEGGAVGNAQFPIMYALGKSNASYALFLDQVYKQEWDFTGNPWRVSMWGDQIRFYLFLGADLPKLRKDYMELVGKPPVAPKKALGLWMSEYGYDSWEELYGQLDSLRQSSFPIDGFVLDLQWFGNVTANSDESRMGTLDWDEKAFPRPREVVKQLADRDGLGLIVIEESYVSAGLKEHQLLAERGYLARRCPGCGPIYLDGNPWWGKGGMIDWTHPEAGSFWHDWKRQPLIDAGVLGHWTDLGEPEMYDAGAWYHGFPSLGKNRQADVHNIYNLAWHESIWQAYERHKLSQRPFLMSRSGTSGIQRYGAAMWSADIGSNFESLGAHFNVQMHVSLAGIDYFGADVGGFHRSGLKGDLHELYTQWFANAAMFDIPLRPHTENLCNCKEVAPNRVGDSQSNLANLRQRYQLTPYLYSLMHQAYDQAEPIFPPLVYYYQNDPNVRTMGHEKMIGRDLLAGVVAQYGERQRDVYLPAGGWYDFASAQFHQSQGEWLRQVPVYRDGLFRLPLFARAGALIPMMHVDEQTMNVVGLRRDGSKREELIVRAFWGQGEHQFLLAEDDGASIAYQKGEKRHTLLTQSSHEGQTKIEIAAAEGSFAGAPTHRQNIVEVLTLGLAAKDVQLNGVTMAKVSTQDEFLACQKCWLAEGAQVKIKTESLPVDRAKSFTISW